MHCFPRWEAWPRPTPTCWQTPGFENDREHWETWPQDLRATVEASDLGNAVAVHVGAEDAVDWRQVYQAVPAAPGDRFEFALEAKGHDVRDGAGILANLACFDKDGKRLEFLDAALPTQLAADWTRLAGRLVAPEGTTEVRLGLFLNGRGDVVVPNTETRAIGTYADTGAGDRGETDRDG